MTQTTRRQIVLGAAAAGLLPGAAFAQKKYGPGTSDTEIRIGQTIAYSGPASAYGQLGRAEAAYFKFLNDKGGINGRKINFISVDDGFSPPKAVEMTRKLVEQDEVALMFGMLGTALNTATRPYLNQQKVPQLFIAAGSATFASGEKFPWTIGWQPTLMGEAAFYAKNILATHPGAKIGVLYQDDDFGKELLQGLREGVAGKDSAIIATESFQATDPTVDSQLISLKGKGVDTLMLFTYAKQAAQAIRKIADLGWKPDTYLHLGSASVGATLMPAGLDKSVGIKTAGFMKDATDPQWAKDAELAPLFRLDEEVHARRQDRGLAEPRRLGLWPDHRTGAAPVWRRPDPREHHEAGAEPEELAQPGPAAGQHHQHRAQRLPRGRVHEAAALQWQGVGVRLSGRAGRARPRPARPPGFSAPARTSAAGRGR